MKLLKTVLLVSCLFFNLVALSTQITYADEESQNIVVHLSSFTNDLRTALIALKFAVALQEDAQVTLFLDQEAVRAGDYRQPQNLKWGSTGPTFSEQYHALVEAGGQIVLCPQSAIDAGISEKYLRNGTKIGTIEGIKKLLLAADKILNY